MDEAQLLTQAGFVGAFYLMYLMVNNTLKENTVALVNIRLTLEKICEKFNLEDSRSKMQ